MTESWRIHANRRNFMEYIGKPKEKDSVQHGVGNVLAQQKQFIP